MSYETRILKVSPEALREAAGILRAGGLVAFPTETVYGLGADATCAEAVERIYSVKERPADNPLIVHLAQAADLQPVADPIPEEAFRLAERFWPGPLTLVLPAREAVRPATRGLSTVAARVPDQADARELIRLAGRPVAAPSANLSGRPSPTTARHVLDDLSGRIPLILDAGPCRVGVESTVLDLCESPPKILRPGGIPREDIEDALGRPVEVPESASPRSPGTLHRHYQPRSPLYLIASEASRDSISAFLDETSANEGEIGYLGDRPWLRQDPRVTASPLRATPEEKARHLYADLRRLDSRSPKAILADTLESSPLQPTLQDRLTRAASGVIGDHS